MMSSFGYRPNNTLILEGSGPKIIGNSRIAKPSTLGNQGNGMRSLKTDSGKMKKDNENTRSVNVVSDDISRSNAGKANKRSMSSTRRGDLNGKEQIENMKTSINDHAQSKTAIKGCSLDKTGGIQSEERVRKQQPGVSKIARMGRLSEVRSSKFAQGKIPTKLCPAEDQQGSKIGEVLENGFASRHEELSGSSLKTEDSDKPQENALAVITNQAGSQRKLQSFSTTNRSFAKESTTSIENANEVIKGSAVSKKVKPSNTSGNRIAAALKPQEDSSETIANCTNFKKPMQSFIPSNGIKGIPVHKKSDQSDSKSICILPEKQTTKLSSSAPRASGLTRPKEISANVKNVPKEKSKTSITGNEAENHAPVLAKKSGVTVIEHTCSSLPRKTDYSRYNEREEIKPRALANANKGRVAKATAQKPRQKIVKEGVVAKRGGLENKAVDCNLQKKQFRENKAMTKEEVANGESLKGDGPKEQSIETEKGLQLENERCVTENSLEKVDVKAGGIGEQNSNLRNDTLKKDVKKVTFDERVVENYATDKSHERKKRGDEIGKDDFSRGIAGNASWCEKEISENKRDVGIYADKESRNKPSTPEKFKKKGDSLVSALIGLPKPKTKAELMEDYGNRMKHMEESVGKQQNDDIKDAVKPIRNAHVLIDEIVYKNKASLSPPERVLQTFSDQDLRAAVEESKRVCGFRNDRVYNSGSLDRIDLRTRSKMKKRQNEYEDIVTLKSYSDPKLKIESQAQELSSCIKEGAVKEKERYVIGNSIQSFPITEPIVREPARGAKMPVLVGRDFTLGESSRSKGEIVQSSHVNSRNAKDANIDVNSTLLMPMNNIEKDREVNGNMNVAAMHQEARRIPQGNAKTACITLETSINEARKEALKHEGVNNKSINGPCVLVGNDEGRRDFAAYNGSYLKKEDQSSDIVVRDTSGLISSKNSNAILEAAPKQSIPKATIPPTPPKRTVTNNQRDPMRIYQDCDSSSNFTNGNFHSNGPLHGLVNVVSGKQFSDQPVSQSNCVHDCPATTSNWPLTNQFTISANSVLAAKQQQGHRVEQQSSFKTNKTDVSTRDKKDVSFSGVNSVGVVDEGKMGQSNAILARPKMPARDGNLNGIGAPNERHMSPIFEDARSQKPGIYMLNSNVNEMLLNREFRMDELNNKTNIKYNARDAAQVDKAQSVRKPQLQRSSSVPNPNGAGVEENTCKVTKSRDSHSDKPKPSSFIASLVRMLQDGRDESKVTSPESTEPLGYDKTVLVDMQVQQNCDPIGLTDDAYFVDEEDPFYQFSLKQGLCDRQARYRKVNATQEGTVQQTQAPYNKDSYFSHDKLNTAESTAGLSTERHGTSGVNFEERDKCEPAEIRLRPTTLSLHSSHDFITISGHKDRREDSPQDYQPTRLNSFSTTTSIDNSTAIDDMKAPRAPAIMRGVKDLSKVNRGTTSNANISLQDDRSAEVLENVRKLAELNLLKNSLKVAHASAKSGKKSSSKRKTKKTNASLWESGKNALFYADNEDLFLTADFELNAPTKRQKHARDCSDLPEAEIRQASAVESQFKNNAKRSKMDAKSEALVATDYYKSVIKDGKNGNAGDQDIQADFIQRKSTVDGFRFTHVAVNDVRGSMSSPKPKPSAKIKPYTVVDLSTMSALTPEEVDSCLKEVSEAENRSLEKADNASHCENIEHDEAPHTLILPPKTSRKRSNTTAGDISSEQKGKNYSVNKDGQDFASLKIVSTDDYSQPGTSAVVELSSFRARSKTAPSIKDQSKKASEGHKLRSYTKQQSCDVDQSSIVCISPINRKELVSDHCGTAVQGSEVVSLAKHSMSQDFPPPPSEVELDGKENERTQTPDWPPVPDSVESVGSQSLKSVFLGTENSNQEPDPVESTQNGRAPDADKQTKVCDPHRSLPPIPGNGSHGSSIPDAPLAWVSRATPHGTGPFIPMCQSTEDMDDLIKSHFYDDIDQIRKVAQERAMMIKRLEEEEAKGHSADHGAGKVNGRVSLGDMPDLIPNSDDCKTAEGGKDQDIRHVVADIEQGRLNDKDLRDSPTHTNEIRNSNNTVDAKQSVLVTTFEKKNKSKFSRLFRKFSAHKSVDLVECKAVTPQPSRRETYTSKREADRNEIFATPATNRRLFSLSKSRPERHRTLSETGSLKALSDCHDADEPKRSKNRTVSFGFGRKKAKREAKLMYKDGQSLQSLEALKMSSDVSSDSGSSTRLSPMTSPTLLEKESGVRKYHAPEPPRPRHVSEDSNFSLRSDLSGKSSDCTSSGDELAKDSHGKHTLAIQRFLKQDDEEVGQRLYDVNTEAHHVEKDGILAQRNKLKAGNPQLSAVENEKSIGDGGNDVFVLEGDYDNYPPSKIHSDKPVKPPRSESEDKEASQPTSKKPPEKPLRRSRELGIPEKPEPYSSQRSFRKITDTHSGIGARLSPSSTSEDESIHTRDYQVPFDYIGSQLGSKTVKSSTSDYCLSGHFQRGNMLYNSDRSMERPSRFGRQGSFSSEVVGDSYYENLQGVADEREGFMDSYDKLLEIHQDTVRQIAEATAFKCECKELRGTDWNDFEIRGKMLNYGISSYVTVPVAVKKSGKKTDEKYTAWLRQSFGFLQSLGGGDIDFSVRDVTMHENLLHICQDIRCNGNSHEENSDEVPHDIHVKRMLVSKVTPRMGLAKYLTLTMDRHARDPESYEKEACLIILQILKGLGHLGKHGLMVDSIDSESILLSDVHRGVLSPNFNNKNNNNNYSEVLGCPIAMYLALPGLLEKCQATKPRDGDENSNLKSRACTDNSKLCSESNQTVAEPAEGVGTTVKEVVNGMSQANLPEVETSGKISSQLGKNHSKQLVNLIFDVFHASHLLNDGLEDDEKTIDEAPILPVRSLYTNRLQRVVEKLLHDDSISIEDLVREFQVISFCPLFVENIDREELLIMLNKWRNRRCVDMVTDILKKYSLISLASGLASGGTNSMGLARNCVLECQFLSSVTAQDIASIVSEIGL